MLKINVISIPIMEKEDKSPTTNDNSNETISIIAQGVKQGLTQR